MDANEIYLNPDAMYKDYREQYSKANKLGIRSTSYENNKDYNESGSTAYRWFRSPNRGGQYSAGAVKPTGY